jgi:hypothetical protein
VAETTSTRSMPTRENGRQPRRSQYNESSSNQTAKTPNAVERKNLQGREDRLVPVRKIPFWGMAAFLSLYGIEQFPEIHDLGSVWTAGFTGTSHTLAIGLGFFFTAEIVKRSRAWISSKVHIQLEGSIRLGERDTTNPESRDA